MITIILCFVSKFAHRLGIKSTKALAQRQQQSTELEDSWHDGYYLLSSSNSAALPRAPIIRLASPHHCPLYLIMHFANRSTVALILTIRVCSQTNRQINTMLSYKPQQQSIPLRQHFVHSNDFNPLSAPAFCLARSRNSECRLLID